MKKLFTIIALLAMATAAQAAQTSAKSFATWSGASAAVKTSDAVNVRGFKTKTMTVTGAVINSPSTNPTFGNMSGTFLIQCGPTTSGPWTTCVANDYAQTAVSRTTSGTFTWTDAAAYVRLYWTAGTTGKKLKAWLNLTE